jgi:integrase/recombinase XerC
MKTLEVLKTITTEKPLNQTTIQSYTSIFKRLNAKFPEYPETPAQFNQYLASLTCADQTKLNHYRILKASSEYLLTTYEIPTPFDKKKVIRPRPQKKQRRYFTSQELLDIINACKTDHERALIMTLIDSTSRIGELATLTRDNVKSNHILVSGKTGHYKKRLDQRLCQVLLSLPTNNSNLVFHKTVGSLKGTVHYIIKRAGITGEKLGAHSLRHSSASLIARKTKSVLAVKAILSHQDQAMSMEYIHDVEDSFQQETSPLQLLGEDLFGENSNLHQQSPLMLTNGSTTKEETDTTTSELYNQMFQPVPDNLKIRPQLNTNDLNLIRQMFIHFCQTTEYSTATASIKQLYNRVLRKVK